MIDRIRRWSGSNVYHVIVSAVNQQQIFEEDEDFKKFLYIFGDTLAKYELRCHSYCLMSNHVHMLLTALELTLLSHAMQYLQSRFARWYNGKYERRGHLFEGRFTSKPVEDVGYFLKVHNYIHENPVRAGICRYALDYPWSSVGAYYGAKNDLVTKDFVLSLFGSAENFRKMYGKYASLDYDERDFEMLPEPKRQNEDVTLRIFKELTSCRSPADFQRFNRTTRNNYIRILWEKNATQRQIARLTGCSRGTVARVVNREIERQKREKKAKEQKKKNN